MEKEEKRGRKRKKNKRDKEREKKERVTRREYIGNYAKCVISDE